MMLNQQTRTLKLTRGEMCDVLLALSIISSENPDVKKWDKLLTKARSQFDAQDPEEYRRKAE